MKVIVFGASGMVGQGVLRECLLGPILKWLFPKHITTTERVGRAMIRVAREGTPQTYLENADINRLGQRLDAPP